MGIIGFDWLKYGYLLDSKFEGARNTVLKFFIEYSGEIAFLLGMIAIGFEIIKIMSSQNPAIHLVILKIFLTIGLTTYYEPLCTSAIKYADSLTQVISDSSSADMSYLFSDTMDKAKKANEDNFQILLGGGLSEEEAREKANEVTFNPYKISLINFNIYSFLASVLLALCHIAIKLISKMRNIVLALLLLIGRFCIVGFIWDKTEGIAKGWLISFLNALSWTVWLSVIVAMQYMSGLANFISNTSSIPMLVDGIVSLIIFLLFYIMIFNLNRELFSGSLGSAASSLATATGLGFAAKGMLAGAKKGAEGLANMKGPSFPPTSAFWGRSSSNGLSQMDPNIKPINVNTDAHYLPEAPKQIDVGNTPSAPEPPKAMELDGPIIDVDYEVKN